MANKLYNILVPVDFTNKNKWAIIKAIELSNSFNCNIHLVHVTGKRSPLFFRDSNVETSLKKIGQIKTLYKNQLCGEGSLEISVLGGSRQRQLVKYAQQYEMDLVVTGLSKFNLIQRIISSVSISRLARKANIPVLAIRSGGLVCHFKKIVLPVSGEVPMRQIRLAALLGRAFRSTVYFVSLRRQAGDKAQGIIDSSLEMLQSISTIPVQCLLLEGENLAKSTLEFSKKINADLIMINPIKDFRLPGLWNRLTNKLLSYGSKIPVVTIASNHNQM
jgi:nucleotide-binding universal stress UspA family protein